MIEYFTNALTPGRMYFRCDRLRSSLSVEACATNWREANHNDNERRYQCKGCPLGASHAGEDRANLSRLKGTDICARCHRTSMRLIGGHRCVSCYNRERELRVGKNAKGRAPTRIAALEPRRLWFWMGDQRTNIHVARSLDMDELIVAALRDSRDRVRFVFQPPAPPVPQFGLFGGLPVLAGSSARRKCLAETSRRPPETQLGLF